MKIEDKNILMDVLLGIVIGVGVSFMIFINYYGNTESTGEYKEGYKAGQVDYLKGITKYEIVNVPTVKEKKR